VSNAVIVGVVDGVVTPTGPPSSPTIATVTAGDKSVVVTVSAPSADSPRVVGYAVVATPGGFYAVSPEPTLTITGLQNGVAYTFLAEALNEVGVSGESTRSALVTPAAATPSQPFITRVWPGQQSASVAFDAPLSSGSK
jgi:titin